MERGLWRGDYGEGIWKLGFWIQNLELEILYLYENIVLQIIFCKTKKVSEVLDQPGGGPNLRRNLNLSVEYVDLYEL